MIERRPLQKKVDSSPTSLIVFGRPQLLDGEDRAAYDELFARVSAAVKPMDIIDEIYVGDLVTLQWDILRLRRFKFARIRALGLKQLQNHLNENLEYRLYSDHFADDITEILRDNLPKDQLKNARKLAEACARNEPDAVEKVENILLGIDMDEGLTRRMDKILRDASARKAKELFEGYARREAEAMHVVDEILAAAGRSMDDLAADAVSAHLDEIERIDQLIAFAETRRSAALLEIERHQAVLAERVRRSMQEIDHGEFKLLGSSPETRNDAA